MSALERFIITSKAHCYIGGGQKEPQSCRTQSHDLTFRQGPFSYMDSYFGGTDFIGQEVVWENDIPVWAMNYYGRILRDEQLNAETAGHVIQCSLRALYQQGRFLGGHEHSIDGLLYRDQSYGSYESFGGVETISRDGHELYRLDYHGGLIRQ